MSEPNEETTPDQRRQAAVIPPPPRTPIPPQGARESITAKLGVLNLGGKPEVKGDEGGEGQ